MIINFASIGSGGGSGSGSTVQWQQTVTAGTQIAQITIDGTSQNVYAPEGGSAEQDYVIVEDLSAITTPTDGMIAYVKGTIAVDRLANVASLGLNGWAGGMAQFVEGEDYTIYGTNGEQCWYFPYRTGTPIFNYYWAELDPGVYIRTEGGNLWVAWNSEDYPSATMMGNNFTNSDNKWGEDSGQTFYITLDHNEGLNVYRNGEWVPMKKQYNVQDLFASTALTKEVCDRTAAGETDITLADDRTIYALKASSPNTWNNGETSFIGLRVDTSNSNLQYLRKFIRWNDYGLSQDATWEYTLPDGGPTVIDFDAMTQAEKAAFFAELQPIWSGTSVNGDYVFLKSYNDYTPDSQGTRQFRLQLFNGEGNTLHFGATISTHSQRAATILYDLYSDGSDRKEVGAIQSYTEVQSNGYFDNRSDYIIFDEATSALTTTRNSGEALINGYQFGGSLYWFIAEPYAGSWSYAIPLLGFKIIDSNGEETMHYFPSTSTKSITTTTVDGVDYNKEFTADYGKFTFKMLMNSDPKGANFTVTYNR